MFSNKNNFSDNNICTHFGEDSIKNYNAIAPEIVQTSNFSFDTYENFLEVCKDEKNSYMYTRGTNPTTEILEKKLAMLENGEKCKVFSSGMGAITATLLSLLEKDDHILTLNTIYGQATTFLGSLSKFGIDYSTVRVDSIKDVEEAITDKTKIIYFESPSSRHMELLDLEAISKLAKSKNIITIVDNTWATPIYQKPLNHGIDIVVHSCSKYIGGSSDVVAGAVISKTETVNKIFEYGHQNLGATNSPFNSWLLIRSLRTLPMRVEYHNNSVKKVIDYMLKEKRIKAVYHPYCGSDKQKLLAQKYLKGYTSLLSFEMEEDNYEKLKSFVNNLKIFKIGFSWGGHESLILPAFKGNNEEILKKRGLSKMHVRLYLGIEDPNTIITDLKDALDKVYY